MTRILRAFVADDERLARLHLLDLLDGEPDVECVGQAADGPSTVQGVESCRPDLLFLDVHMPRMTGIEVLNALRWQPRVIFTTAHDQYAVAAFELQAVDYLLKPFGRERLQRALTSVRRDVAPDPGEPAAAEPGARTGSAKAGSLTRVFARQRGRIVPINAIDIQRLEAHDDYVMLQTDEGSYLVSLRMRDFEERLDPDRFLRVHRSHIVNLDFVTAIEPLSGSRLRIRLRDGTAVVASRSRSKALRRLVI